MTEPDSSLSDRALVEQMINCYGRYGADAETRVSELLAELHRRDSVQGDLWQDIMQYWNYVNADLPIHPDRLPDGLPDDDTLCLAVLGYALNADGSMKSELISRLETALNCAQQYPNAYVLCTGGGTAVTNRSLTEGGQMGDWLLAHGLSPERLIVEEASRTTAANAVNSYAILQRDYPQVRSVAIISSDYHIAWGALMFETVFLQAAAVQQAPELHVISDCACTVKNSLYQPEDHLRWQTSGLLEIFYQSDFAMQKKEDAE
jgi:hypothetical protein